MVNESEGCACVKRREAQRAYPGYQARPKMDMYLGQRVQISRCNHSTQIPA